jgi:hypothetical protein
MTIDDVRRNFGQHSHWRALGRGGAAYAREAIATLRTAGYRPVGTGRPPAGADVIYGPTGTVDWGGRGRRVYHYIGRWARQGG